MKIMLELPGRSSSWTIASGCTTHTTFDSSSFVTYSAVTDSSVGMGTKETTPAVGRGDVSFKMRVGSDVLHCTLQDVLHVPPFEEFF